MVNMFVREREVLVQALRLLLLMLLPHRPCLCEDGC